MESQDSCNFLIISKISEISGHHFTIQDNPGTLTLMNPIQQLSLVLTLTTGASGALVFPDSGLASPLAIPDHDASGILRAVTVTGLDTGTAYAVSVALDVQGTGYGGFVGDLYAYLAHQAPDGSYTMTVLLNRPGRSDLMLSGYDDAGLNIVLSDDAAHDIHTYQSQSYQLGTGGALTGSWQPDRRLADPDTVTDASARAATTLSSIVNGDPNGTWYCFIADMETGATMQLTSWSVSFAVPEASTTLTLGALAASALLVRRRRGAA